MIEAATPMKPKKGAEEGQRSETAASNTVDSILFTVKESKKIEIIVQREGITTVETRTRIFGELLCSE